MFKKKVASGLRQISALFSDYFVSKFIDKDLIKKDSMVIFELL